MSLRLRPYQVEGVGFLASHPRAFLADEMGLGKSAQLLQASALARGDVLIVAPAMVLDGGTWTDEIARWLGPPSGDRFGTLPYSKLASHGTKPVVSQDGKLVTYSRAPRRWDKLLRPEIPQKLGAVVFDEAHYLKGRGSLRSNLGQALAARADYVYLATGTPIPNFAPELFPLLQILNPEEARNGGKYGSYWRWVKRWFRVTPSSYSQYEVGGLLACGPSCDERPPSDPCEHYREFSASELGDRFLQRRRDDVLTDLPPLTQIEVEVPMGPKQASAYRSMKRDMVATLGDGSEVVAWSQSAKHVQLDRIATGLDLLGSDPAKPTADNAKLARLAEDLQARSRPTLVMAHYQPTVEACLRVARGLGLTAELVYGPTSKAERLRSIRLFQQGKLDVLVGSLETLAEGLTLVAADVVIFVEKSWKPSRNEQAVRRVHRLGQTRPVTAIDYITPKTIDAGKRELLKVKTDHQMRVLTAAQLARIA